MSLFWPPSADLASFVLETDVIYVGGGNTRSMLALWREWDIDDGAALHFVDGVLRQVVISRPKATAYVVEKTADEVKERPLEKVYLAEKVD